MMMVERVRPRSRARAVKESGEFLIFKLYRTYDFQALNTEFKSSKLYWRRYRIKRAWIPLELLCLNSSRGRREVFYQLTLKKFYILFKFLRNAIFKI
jgi:hypothetical protein